ncbi:hypothetical protein EDC01DRAFT_782920 [Geopyxis carbonaria]|nr:hypothetical protein EDC01DRAFT_782920 [Geopyxis carbonaria]
MAPYKGTPIQHTKSDLVGHPARFVIEESETTGTALSAILYFIAKHPDVAKRLRKELHTHYGSAAPPPASPPPPPQADDAIRRTQLSCTDVVYA